MKNLKKIADELHNSMKDLSFESFIADQVLSFKSSHDVEPCFSISHHDITLDVWKKDNDSFELIKSVLPGAPKKAGKDYRKIMKRNEIVEEIVRLVDSFLD